MEEKNKKNSKNYKKVNSPILDYYSDIVNSPNLHYNSDIIQNNHIIFPKNLQSPLANLNFKKKQKKSVNNSTKKDSNEVPKKDNFEPIKIKDNPKIEPENNIINSNILKEQKDFPQNKISTKNIKSIKEDDLIPTSINGRVILRINPLVYKNESYEFLSSNIYILLKDQLGCKFLQEKLDNDSGNAIFYFFPALIPNLTILIKDSFANYFIQKMFFYLNDEQIEYILKILAPEFFDICIDSHGTRAIQCIINFLDTEKLRIQFFEMVKPIFISLINELNGTHIIYKLMNFCPEFLNQINKIIIENCLTLATHKRGCFFIQNYLIFLTNNNNYNLKKDIIDNLLNNCLILIVDKTGNYLIQYLLTLRDQNIILNIINQILNNIAFYSKHKYSSYVIEKLFLFSSKENKNKLIEKLSHPDIMSDLIFDQQGNFIILKSLMCLDNEKIEIMLNIINNLEPKIKKFSYGKTFLKNLYNIFPNLNKDFNNNYNNKKENK